MLVSVLRTLQLAGAVPATQQRLAWHVDSGMWVQALKAAPRVTQRKLPLLRYTQVPVGHSRSADLCERILGFVKQITVHLVSR